MADAAARVPVDVYLLPAPIGGGSGDIDEVFVAGETLARRGARVRLLRLPGRPFPGPVADASRWPRFPRVDRLGARRAWAVTVSAAWGVTAAPRRPGPLGGAGPWAEESAAIERAYGAQRTVHVSLEEFARTLTSREQSVERYREGGRTRAGIARVVRTKRFRREVRTFQRAFRRFRAFDVPNVLSVFPGFVRGGRFQREFPEAVQTGPLWPRRHGRGATPAAAGRWLWYADSPAAGRLGRGILEGLDRSSRRPRLDVRCATAGLARAVAGPRVRLLPPLTPTPWRRAFGGADLRIVTGSRSLLEALEVGGPFLYFNGVSGSGRRARRHRPEKFRQLLQILEDRPGTNGVRRDLIAFAAGRRVPEVVAAATRSRWRRDFPRAGPVRGYAAGFGSANALLGMLVRDLRRADRSGADASTVVRRLRARSRNGGAAAARPN